MTTIDAHDIVRDVLDAFRGLPGKLALITDKSVSWYQSHGRTPKTHDAEANGNVSPVTHYLRYVRLFEMAEPGSGRMLNNRTFASLDQEFAEHELTEAHQSELHIGVIAQSCDVQKWLAQFDLKHAGRNDLLGFEKECDEAIEAILNAKSSARARIRTISLERAS